MKNKPKFKIFRVFHSKKAQIAVSQAIKVITSIVLGGALLVGGVVTTNQIVLHSLHRRKFPIIHRYLKFILSLYF